MAANKSPQKQQQQQQQSRQQHLHLATSSSNNNNNNNNNSNYSFLGLNSSIFIVVAVVLGLLLATNCVNGQIDGYVAGEDYPAYDAVPRDLAFNCQGRQPGYYADTETRCQVWHWCLHSGHQYSFLCPNGTVFNQAVRVCDWWSNVNCDSSEQLYRNNEELYRIPERQQQQNEQNERCPKMKPMDWLLQLSLHILQIFKIYLKFGLLTLALYFMAEWYIVRFGPELGDQLDAKVAANERPTSNSTLSQVFRIVLNFFVL
ncbi:hypothetical protein ACLKA7_017619 [Drosophila subpalustris]